MQSAQGSLKFIEVRRYAVRGMTRHPSDQDSQRAGVPKGDSEAVKTTGGGLFQSPMEGANDRGVVPGQCCCHFAAELGGPWNPGAGNVTNYGLKEMAFQLSSGGRAEQFPPDLSFVPEASLKTLPELSLDPSAGPEEDRNRDIAVAHLPDEARQPPEPLIRHIIVRVAFRGRDEESMGDAEFAQVSMQAMKRLGIRRGPVRAGPESALGPKTGARDLRAECRRLSRGGF